VRAERLTLLGVAHRVVDAALRRADREGRDGDPALVEDPQEVGVAAAALAEQVLRGHPHVVELSACVSEAFQPTLS
jgi:hypothetical protein